MIRKYSVKATFAYALNKGNPIREAIIWANNSASMSEELGIQSSSPSLKEVEIFNPSASKILATDLKRKKSWFYAQH